MGLDFDTGLFPTGSGLGCRGYDKSYMIIRVFIEVIERKTTTAHDNRSKSYGR